MRQIEPRKTPCYCMNFRHMANALTKFYNSRLAAADLTANQLSLLIDIQSIEPCNHSELARCSGLDRTTIIRNLKPLIKKELIEVSGQNSSLILTPQGLQAIEAGSEIWLHAQREIKELFDEDCRSALRTAFSKIKEIEAMI